MIREVVIAINHFLEQVNIPVSTVQNPSKLDEIDTTCDIASQVKDFISALQECLKIDEKEEDHVASDLIQITASKAELDKRIAAFIAHSQQAIDEQNVQEFCQNSLTTNPSCCVDSCARTGVLYKRRPANITHLQVSRVNNEEGPQTNVNNQGNWVPQVKSEHIRPQNTYRQADCPPGLMERLDNLQDHLKITQKTAPKDVYDRLKEMERRVLHLESLSPEYFSLPKREAESGVVRSRSRSLEDSSPDPGLNEIDDRIRYLKRKLLKRS